MRRDQSGDNCRVQTDRNEAARRVALWLVHAAHCTPADSQAAPQFTDLHLK
ncbi:MAG TPA: hypothetical protein VKE94_17750 [Gemmataceae bacterium]|nr:hypothetical protein [Gemmataceae bacterium]